MATRPEPPRRGRGSRAGLDLDRIIAAAHGMDPETLTMQSLADALGVDRKALNHHVTDRQSLFELLALDAFRRRFGDAEVTLGTTWQDACRAYAHGMVESLLDIGAWSEHFRFTSQRDLTLVGPAEAVAERMLAAGYEPVTVSRSMHLLATICTGFARDALNGRRTGGHPQIEELRRALDDARGEYDALRRLVDARVDNFGHEQLDFDLDAFITAIERLPH
ncbi:hypothetical protein [Microbacterium invictum]|uniref:AcrR family transcriptional regulator n=1 Tax=Microbacterium invictum TaxID=515415 RepID=A0AA40SLE6_9MICO|nr:MULTISPECIES: hypothetical protein [Microbacterium]MBB4138385.1 AcrR family transcriptional regulator [Microbacterium invictum]